MHSKYLQYIYRPYECYEHVALYTTSRPRGLHSAPKNKSRVASFGQDAKISLKSSNVKI